MSLLMPWTRQRSSFNDLSFHLSVLARLGRGSTQGPTLHSQRRSCHARDVYQDFLTPLERH